MTLGEAGTLVIVKGQPDSIGYFTEEALFSGVKWKGD